MGNGAGHASQSGKPFHPLLHHTNLEEAESDKRKLVCFDCGIACDLTKMREERLVYLRKLGAEKPSPEKLPVVAALAANPDPRNAGRGQRRDE